MSDVDRHPDAPELGLRAIRMVVVYFERTYGRARLEKAFVDWKLPLPISHLENDANYVSLAFAERLLDALCAESGEPRFMEKASRWAATPQALGFAYYLLRSLGTPGLLYRKAVELGPTYNKVGTFEIQRETGTSLELVYRSRVPETKRNFCVGRQGTFASFPTIWGLPEAEVRELECAVQGGACCRYQLTWVKPALNYRRWIGLAAGLALGAYGLWQLGWGWPSLAVLGASGLFLGGWLDSVRAIVQKEGFLEEQRDGMTRSLVELEQRANQLYRANVELDARVATRTRELDEALKRLEHLDELKNAFFANLSHELRTPLTLILTPVEQLFAAAPDPHSRQVLAVVRANARRLLRLIDDLLDLSRIDAGYLRLTVAPVDLAALAREVTLSFAPAAEAAGATLELVAPRALADTWGDVHRLEMILSTLIASALEQSGGRVKVSVVETGAEAIVTVEDDGPAADPAELAALFERFSQLGEGRRRGGEGIGLSLANELAQLHGGALRASSGATAGTTFTLTLPRGNGHFKPEALERRQQQTDIRGRRATDRAEPTPSLLAAVPAALPVAAPVSIDDLAPLIDGRRPRVLVVEDNADIRAILEEILGAEADVLMAKDGVEGFEVTTAQRPDLVVADDMMPRLRGTELCAKLKASPELRAIPVVMLTARRGAEAALESYAHGADEFVEKPFHPKVLLARVRAQLRLRAQAVQLGVQMRLAGVGLLAAGVGHEVRNPVNVVLNGAKLLAETEGADPLKKRIFDRIIEAAKRIDQISGALLSHASPADAGGMRPVDVVQGLESTLELLSHRLEGVTVHRTAPQSAAVLASATELGQVFMNLVDNALKAPARNLWLTVSESDSAVAIDIADDGPGITIDRASHLFSPFFTTRSPGEGTGLGLYLSRTFVRRWGGELRFSPRAGGGAVFTVELPRERA